MMARWQSANVLQSGAAGGQLWRFSADGNRFKLEKQQSLLPGQRPPDGLVAKDWETLFRGKLNIAWAPPDKVFLRVVHLPSSDPTEIASMVELQLEKLSPLPINQVVWGTQILPKPADKPDALQPVVVIMAARSFAEEFLGELEARGYLTDRLEAPSLDQLLGTKISGDGVWVYLGAPGDPALVAWWADGLLRQLALCPLPADDERVAALKGQIEQMAWSGELEGWLGGPPRVHLVATAAEAAFWEPHLRDLFSQPVEILAPQTTAELAAASAARAAGADSKSNLMPPETTARYKQKFIDGLWMRGLFAVVLLYLAGVLAYFSALYMLKYKTEQQQALVTVLGNSYTNALRDSERLNILKGRQELKYAALDCWKAVAENLPTTLGLDGLSFQGGKLTLSGTVSGDAQSDVITFNEALGRIVRQDSGEAMFSEVQPAQIVTIGNNSANWRFNCRLRGSDTR